MALEAIGDEVEGATDVRNPTRDRHMSTRKTNEHGWHWLPGGSDVSEVAVFSFWFDVGNDMLTLLRISLFSERGKKKVWFT